MIVIRPHPGMETGWAIIPFRQDGTTAHPSLRLRRPIMCATYKIRPLASREANPGIPEIFTTCSSGPISPGQPGNRPRRRPRVRQVGLDVVGIGAVNLDVIVTAAAASARADLELLLAGVPGGLDWGAEVFVAESTVYAAVEAVGAAALTATLGGSAFNTVHALARLGRDLRLGYVGVAGRVPVPGLSSLALLDRLGVDRTHVRTDPATCGLCFSFAAAGERTMITAAGANVGLAGHLAGSFDALVGYLAGARVVHLAAPLDDHSPARLLALVHAVRRANPATLISFDPGHGWSTGPPPAVRDLLAASDLVLVNQREFAALGGDGPDEAVAARLAAGSVSDRLVIAVKRPDGVLCCRPRSDRVRTEWLARPPLPAAEIHDPTGAGDMFAAGLLAVLATDVTKHRLGCRLGIELARHAMRHPGPDRHAALAAITATVLG